WARASPASATVRSCLDDAESVSPTWSRTKLKSTSPTGASTATSRRRVGSSSKGSSRSAGGCLLMTTRPGNESHDADIRDGPDYCEDPSNKRVRPRRPATAQADDQKTFSQCPAEHGTEEWRCCTRSDIGRIQANWLHRIALQIP